MEKRSTASVQFQSNTIFGSVENRSKTSNKWRRGKSLGFGEVCVEMDRSGKQIQSRKTSHLQL